MSSTPRVFITGTPFCGDTVRISGSDAHHILNVLRLRRGEKILVCDMKRTEFDGTITEISDGELSVILSGSRQSSSEFPFSVNLYQGVRYNRAKSGRIGSNLGNTRYMRTQRFKAGRKSLCKKNRAAQQDCSISILAMRTRNFTQSITPIILFECL